VLHDVHDTITGAPGLVCSGMQTILEKPHLPKNAHESQPEAGEYIQTLLVRITPSSLVATSPNRNLTTASAIREPARIRTLDCAVNEF